MSQGDGEGSDTNGENSKGINTMPKNKIKNEEKAKRL